MNENSLVMSSGGDLESAERVLKLDGPGPWVEAKLLLRPLEGGRISSPVWALLRGKEKDGKRDIVKLGTLAWDEGRGRYIFSARMGLTSSELKQIARWLDELGRR